MEQLGLCSGGSGWIKCAHDQCDHSYEWKGYESQKVSEFLRHKGWTNIGFFWLCPDHEPKRV